MENPKKKTFCDLDRELLFLTKYRFKKKRLLIRNLIGDHFYEDANGHDGHGHGHVSESKETQ